MISLTIVAENIEQCTGIIKFLLKEKLVVDGTIIENANYFHLNDKGKVEMKRSASLICTTRASLLSHIQGLLDKKYANIKPTIYSVPIVSSDWNKANNILSEKNMDDLHNHYY